MNSNYVKVQTVAILIGIAKIFIAVSILCIFISIGIGIFSGYGGWKKDLLIYGITGTILFYLLSVLLKFVHDKMDKF